MKDNWQFLFIVFYFTCNMKLILTYVSIHIVYLQVYIRLGLKLDTKERNFVCFIFQDINGNDSTVRPPFVNAIFGRKLLCYSYSASFIILTTFVSSTHTSDKYYSDTRSCRLVPTYSIQNLYSSASQQP